MKIGICELISSLHKSAEFSKENEEFLSSIEAELNQRLDIVNLKDDTVDLKLIFIQSGGSENLFLKNISSLKSPYYLLTSGSNNSLAASLEILTYINSIGEKGEILHGSPKYIAKRIREICHE